MKRGATSPHQDSLQKTQAMSMKQDFVLETRACWGKGSSSIPGFFPHNRQTSVWLCFLQLQDEGFGWTASGSFLGCKVPWLSGKWWKLCEGNILPDLGPLRPPYPWCFKTLVKRKLLCEINPSDCCFSKNGSDHGAKSLSFCHSESTQSSCGHHTWCSHYHETTKHWRVVFYCFPLPTSTPPLILQTFFLSSQNFFLLLCSITLGLSDMLPIY